MRPQYNVVVIVPCFNEAKRLNFLHWMEFISTHTNYLFIFINDGSVDDTARLLIENPGQLSNVIILENSKNQGKADAVRTGLLYAYNNYDYTFISFIDADLSSPLSELKRFAGILEKNNSIDFLLGSRIQMLGKKIKRNLLRHYIGRVIATFICKVLNEPVYDTQCGIKMFRREALQSLLQQPFYTRWLFDVELLARYKIKHGSDVFNERIKEVPVNEWTEKENSKLKYYQFTSILLELLKIKRKYFHTSQL